MGIDMRLLFLLSLLALTPPKRIKVWLVGDSTMSDKDVKAYPETGWGMPFAHFFDATVVVDNRAKNGRSTKSFMEEGSWQSVTDHLQPGDYVFIQFGHNDEVKEKVGRYTTPDEFKTNLERYVSGARDKGAIPVLLTPVARRKFSAAGIIEETHPVYADAVKEVAEKEKVTLIDLDKKSKALLQTWGPERSTALFNYLAPGEHPNYPAGHKDDTHFNELGARKMAELVLEDIRRMLPDLAARIRAPEHIITVAADGTGDYRTVQAALDAVPLNNIKAVTINIKRGIYREKLHLDSTRDHVTLVGEDKWNTILTYDDHTGKVSPAGDTINTRSSYSCIIRAGGFTARHLTFRNDAGSAAGQAVALEVQGDRACIEDCRLIGNQDVLFLNSPESRQYYHHCYIEGTTDFIFGAATAWFGDCHIHSKRDSHVTAASTPANHPYGFVFSDCTLTGDTAIHHASLGRPWRPWSDVIFIICYIGGHIRPEGWSVWNNNDNHKTARYSEYQDYGPGADVSRRVPWSHQLTEEEAHRITIKNIFGDWQPAEN